MSRHNIKNVRGSVPKMGRNTEGEEGKGSPRRERRGRVRGSSIEIRSWRMIWVGFL